MPAISWDIYGIKNKNPTKEELQTELDRLELLQADNFEPDALFQNTSVLLRQKKINTLIEEINKK